MILRLTILFFFLKAGLATGQTLTYAVLLKDEKIGELIVRRTSVRDAQDFKVESSIRVNKIINMAVDYKMSAHFEKGILHRSSIWQRSNKRVTVNTITTRTNDGYLVEKPDGNRKEHDVIDFNLCMLYFQEPVGKKRIWSDSFGAFVKIRAVGAHRYELLLPDGKRSFYTYHYGICSMVEAEQLFSKINFRLLPSK